LMPTIHLLRRSSWVQQVVRAYGLALNNR